MSMTVDLITINAERRTFLIEDVAQEALVTQKFLNPPSIFDNVLILSKRNATELIPGHSIASIALRSDRQTSELFPHIRPEVSLLPEINGTQPDAMSIAGIGNPETLTLYFLGGQCVWLKLLGKSDQFLDVDLHQRITNAFTYSWIFYSIDNFSMGLANVRNLERIQLNFSPEHLPRGTLCVIKELRNWPLR